LIVAAYVSQPCNDKKEIAPMVAALEQLPAAVGKADEVLVLALMKKRRFWTDSRPCVQRACLW
jgi:hypothetical protein